jgi:hypothetical protein
VADHPLRPATDRCLGEQLPHQLANQTQAPLLVMFPSLAPQHYGVLAAVSQCYPPPKGRFLRVPHPFATATKVLSCEKSSISFNLHVLSMLPAFNLSQDQTLHKYFLILILLI